jgi:hypothetical protein
LVYKAFVGFCWYIWCALVLYFVNLCDFGLFLVEVVPKLSPVFRFMEVLIMNSFREVNNDILKDWLEFREDQIFANNSEKDKEHYLYFD